MRNLHVFILFLFTLGTAGFAQAQSGKVSGKVLDNKQAPLAAATVSVLKQTDSGSVAMLATDQYGRFQITGLPAGTFFVQISATGHQPTYSKNFDITSNSTDIELPVFVLTASTKELGSVTVVASRPAVEQKIDRTVVNVDATISNIGTNALDVLEKVPGVQVDKDGNISLKGKQGVMILLDGRPTYLSAADLANMLRGMQSSQLDQVEVMTNPPAKYDAAGNSGIINIKTKKNKARGFNGSVNVGAGQGKYFRTWESIALNYRNKKFNLFANYGFDNTENYQQLDIHRTFYNKGRTSVTNIFDQVSYQKRTFRNHNLKLGMDYFISKSTTVGVVLTGFLNKELTFGNNYSEMKSPKGTVDSTLLALSDSRENWKNGAINLNFRHQFDTSGRELTIDLDYIRYKAANVQDFDNITSYPNGDPNSEELLKGDMPANIDIKSAKLDYVHPVTKDTRVEAGWKTSFVENDSKANYFLGFRNGHDVDYTTDYGKTNFFNYRENINAAYVNFNHKFSDKWSVQSGLRFENTNYKGHQFGNARKADSSFENTYNSLFPTVYVSYTPSEKHQFGANFGRRIERPAYQDMNPFLFYIDKFTYGRGNPFLRPQYATTFELNHIYKSMLTTSLQYSESKNDMNEVFDQGKVENGEDPLATIVKKGNFGKRQNFVASMNLQWQVTKWYSSNVYASYGYTKISGLISATGETLHMEANNFFVKLNNQFRFEKGWGAELSGWYAGPQLEGQIRLREMARVDAAVSKQVLKGKGSIKLSVRDLFFTQLAKGDMDFKSTYAAFKNTRDTRIWSINFNYRFGKQAGNNSQRKRSASEEQSRVRSGE